VTHGDFRLLDVFLLPEAGGMPAHSISDDLPVLAGIELSSEHLVGRAVVQYARDRGLDPADVDDVCVRKGEGITATHAGHRYFIGNLKLATALCSLPDDRAHVQAEEWQHAGKTVAYFGRDGAVRGLLAFGDRIKPGAVELVETLRRRGIVTRLVSGDARSTTRAVAARIRVDDFVAEVSPDGKASLIEELQRSGKRVAMIGDGVNDAPALATAEVGIALGTGADVAMSAAPVVLLSGSLEKVEELIQVAGRATRVIHQNLFWAFLYNTAGIALAISGRLNPIMAAGAMLLSSTSVVANSMRLSRPRRGAGPRPQSILPHHEDRMGLGNQPG